MAQVQGILNIKGYQHCIISSKVMVVLPNDCILPIGGVALRRVLRPPLHHQMHRRLVSQERNVCLDRNVLFAQSGKTVTYDSMMQFLNPSEYRKSLKCNFFPTVCIIFYHLGFAAAMTYISKGVNYLLFYLIHLLLR